MQDRSVLIACILLILIGISSAILLSESGNNRSAIVQSISIQTEKELYHSKEIMNISVSIDAITEMNDLVLIVKGVEDSHG